MNSNKKAKMSEHESILEANPNVDRNVVDEFERIRKSLGVSAKKTTRSNYRLDTPFSSPNLKQQPFSNVVKPKKFSRS